MTNEKRSANSQKPHGPAEWVLIRHASFIIRQSGGVWYKCNVIMRKQTRLAALELQALRTMRKFAMLRREEHVLVAASGGADSMALLLCLHDLAPRMNLKLTVAHLNHGIRGEEAVADEAFVRRRSAELGWPFLSESADLKALAAAARQNLEEAAREARYAFLLRAAAGAGAGKIATGHNLDDQAETILFRLLRGSGPGGLEGIRPVIDGRIIRPLLEIPRSEILAFLHERRSGYREDSTNLDLRYRRNRIRHELIPYLQKHFNPRLTSALIRGAALARSAHDFLEEHARLELVRLRTQLPDGVALPASPLMQLHSALRHQVIRGALRELLGSLRGIETIHIESLLGLCRAGQSGRRLELPGGIGAQRNLEWLELTRESPVDEVSFAYQLVWPGQCRVPEAGLHFHASVWGEQPAAEGPGDDAACRTVLDPDALPPCLTIRSRRPGDRYGGPGHRKVKRMLLAARVTLAARATLPMVAAGDVVVWIPGFKPAKTFGVRPGSSRSVLVEARRTTSDQ
jgi:tRNA(Ile)-lysidine synthase